VPASLPSLANEARLAVSGMGGASLFALSFLLHANNERPPLDCREFLSLENMLEDVSAVWLVPRMYGDRAGALTEKTHALEVWRGTAALELDSCFPTRPSAHRALLLVQYVR
jgi:hypothetical protein